MQRQLLALSATKTQISEPQRERLASVLIPAQGGRGITRLAHAEWGRPPEALSESEMTWLFVVGQMPDCSKRLATSETDNQVCARLYESLLAQFPGASHSAP